MPTDTFYRLPQEKRDRLMAAIRAELARVPFSEMSINRVVHEAGIARGSYYQYFTGREDVYQYLFSQLAQQAANRCVLVLDECGGDPFAAAPRLFDAAADYMRAGDGYSAFQNLVSRSELIQGGARYRCCPATGSAFIEQVRPHIAPAHLSRAAYDRLPDLTALIFFLLWSTLMELFGSGGDTAEARQTFLARLDLIRLGAINRDNPVKE